MVRRLLYVSVAIMGLAVPSNGYSDTDEGLRPGYWRVTFVAPVPGAVMEEMCMDRSTERGLVAQTSRREASRCARYDEKFTASGATVDTVCLTDGVTYTSHREITYNSATQFTNVYRFSRKKGGGPSIENVLVTQGNWLGSCPASMKPGDVATSHR